MAATASRKSAARNPEILRCSMRILTISGPLAVAGSEDHCLKEVCHRLPESRNAGVLAAREAATGPVKEQETGGGAVTG